MKVSRLQRLLETAMDKTCQGLHFLSLGVIGRVYQQFFSKATPEGCQTGYAFLFREPEQRSKSRCPRMNQGATKLRPFPFPLTHLGEDKVGRHALESASVLRLPILQSVDHILIL